VNCTRAGILNATQVEQERFLIAASKITCLQDTNDQHYCLNDFYTLSHTNLSQANDATLAQICVPCTVQVLDVLVYVAPKDVLETAAYLNLICLQVANEFCFPKFINALVVMADLSAGGAFTDAKALVWCDACVEQFAFRYVATIAFIVGADAPQIAEELLFLSFHKFACVKDWSGNYCFPQIQANQGLLQTMGDQCMPSAVANPTNPSCSGTCKTAITNVHKTLGCCFGTWFNFVRFEYATNVTFRQSLMGLTPDGINNYITQTCALTLPPGCATQKLAVTLQLTGLDSVWVQQHQAEIQQAVLSYIQWLLAVDAAVITQLSVGATPTTVVNANSVHHLMQVNQPTVASFVIHGDSQAQITNCQNALTTANIVQNSVSPIGSSLPISSRDQTNINQPMSAQSASVTVQPDTSSAFARAPTFVGLVFGILALLML